MLSRQLTLLCIPKKIGRLIGYLGLSLLLSSCGIFHHRTVAQLPQSYQKITLQSPDPYGILTRALESQLRQQGFTLVEFGEKPVLQLQLLNAQEERSLRSLFADGKAAQYQLILRIQAQLQILAAVLPNQPTVTECLPLTTVVSHTFFDKPQMALAASVEQQLVQQQLYQQAAQQTVLQLITLLSKKAGGPIDNPPVETGTIDATPHS